MGKKEGGGKSLVDKVIEVIKVQNSPGGSSRQALLKVVASSIVFFFLFLFDFIFVFVSALLKGMKEQFPEVEASQLTAALKKGVTAKVLEQNGQR